MSDSIPMVQKETYPPDTDLKLNGSPGCGKSTQSIKRLVHSMKEKDLSYNDITVATYRKSLANEILQKLQEENIISENVKPSDTFIGTIHGICRRLLKKKTDIDIETMVSDYHKHLFCTQYNIEYYNNSTKKSAGQKLFSIISYYRTNNIGHIHDIPDEKIESFKQTTDTNYDIDVLVQSWSEFKKNPPEEINHNRIYDFYDLLFYIRELELIPNNEFLIIDEMHDVYPLLNDIIQLWVSETKNDPNKTVIVAGDPLQVINSYQGASAHFFNDTDLPELYLDCTYRCPEQVWNYAKSIIEKEHSNIGIEADSSDGNVELISHKRPLYKYSFDSQQWIIQNTNPIQPTPLEIIEEYENEGQVMFLTRTRNQLQALKTYIQNKKGIIYSGDLDESWTNKKGLLELYNILHTIQKTQFSATSSRASFEHSVKYNFAVDYEVTRPEIMRLYDIIDNKYIKDQPHISAKQYQEETDYYTNISNTYLLFTEELFTDDITDIIDSLHLDDYEKSNIKKEDKIRLEKALERYNQRFSFNNIPVQVRTIHESKGMEAETVVLYDGITPNIEESLNTVEGQKNECQTWFVGATRSSKNLLVVKNSFNNFSKSPYLPETL